MLMLAFSLMTAYLGDDETFLSPLPLDSNHFHIETRSVKLLLLTEGKHNLTKNNGIKYF